jgi:hypothetical protein
MTVEYLAQFFNTPSAFTGLSLAKTLNGLDYQEAMIVLRFLKEASVRDQCFEQASGFRNAEKALEKAAAPTPRTAKRRKAAKPA